MSYTCLGKCNKRNKDDYHYHDGIDELVCFDCVPADVAPDWRLLILQAMSRVSPKSVEYGSLFGTLDALDELEAEDADESAS